MREKFQVVISLDWTIGLVRTSPTGVTVGLPSHNGNFRYPFSRTPRQHLTRVDRIIMAMTVCSSALRVVCAARAPRVKAAGGKVVTSGKKFANLSEAVDAGLIKVSGALWRRSLKMYNFGLVKRETSCARNAQSVCPS